MEDYYVFYHYITLACGPSYHSLHADDGRLFFVAVLGDRLRRCGQNPYRYNILVTENFYNETALESQKTHIWRAADYELLLGEPQGYCRVLRFEVFADYDTIPTRLPEAIGGSELEDITIRTANREFRVSSTKLRCQSEYFAALLRTDCTEAQTNICQFEDIDGEVFAQLVHYLYFGEIDDTEYGLDLYVLADRFEIKSLTEICEHILLSEMDTDYEDQIMGLAAAIGTAEFNKRLKKRAKWNAATANESGKRT